VVERNFAVKRESICDSLPAYQLQSNLIFKNLYCSTHSKFNTLFNNAGIIHVMNGESIDSSYKF